MNPKWARASLTDLLQQRLLRDHLIHIVPKIEPRYVDVIVKRWEDYTGKQAALEERSDA